jgi:hypothetical protein
MKVRRWWVGGLALLAIGLAVCAAAALLLSRSRSPEAVLTDLAALTPLSSTVPQVEAAIRQRHLHEGMCWSETQGGTKTSITVRYADSYGLGLPPERTIIEAHWHFDPEGKLADISVDYYHSGMTALGFTKANDRPITLSSRDDAAL